MRQIVVGSFLFLFIAGCSLSSYEGPPYQGNLYNNTILFHMYEPKIKDGETTEKQILEWFGYPAMVSTDLQGRPQYIYLFERGQRRMDVVFKDGIVYDHGVIFHGGDGTDRGDIRLE